MALEDLLCDGDECFDLRDLCEAQVVCCGETESTVEERASVIGRESAELRQNGLAGTPDEVRTKAAEFADAGCSRTYLQVLDDQDLDHLDILAEALIG